MSTTLAFDHLTKRFGATTAVEDLSATVRPGRVTGFLGPNGAGKTTSLRMLLGLVRPTSGTATFDGRPYAELDEPVREVGTLLEATGFHPGRRARDHLRVLAVAAGRALVELRPETGRTHQLRVHAAHGLGLPIVGDPIYGRGGDAMLLHARSLRVDRGAKPPIEATASVPASFATAGFDGV